MSEPLRIEDFERGMLVEWDWSGPWGENAIEKGIRPVGRVVTRDDLPNMSTHEGPFNVLVLDSPHWVISPHTVLRKGHEMRRYSGPLAENASTPLM
jgi:hypothetical protein